MPGPHPCPVILSDKQQELLKRLCRRQTSPQRLVRRAKTILLAAEGLSNEAIATELGLSRHSVSLWRRRWDSQTERLHAAEAAGDSARPLLTRIQSMLQDAPRPGAPSDFSAEQLTQIIAVACESPEESGRPVTHWTPRERRDEVSNRGLVKTISTRTVGRFFKRSRSQTASLPLLAPSST